MKDDQLSPEPLSSYEEYTETSQEPSSEKLNRENHSNVVGPFTKVDLEKQKRERETPDFAYNLTPDGKGFSSVKRQHHDFKEMQIKYRESVLESKQNRARDDFNSAHDDYGRGLDR